MNQVIAIILLAVVLHNSDCHSDDLCIPVRHDVQGPTSSPVSVQGRPGKIGPPGSRGAPGLQGSQGIPGKCECSLDEIISEIQELKEALEMQNVTMRTLHREQLCYAGVKDGRVRDQDMSASSTSGSSWPAHFGRLDKIGEPWYPNQNRAGDWLQVDFRTPTRIVGIITQGRHTNDQWVTSYKIAYGNSTNSMRTIQSSSGSDLIFQGNRDRNTHVTNMFPKPVTARYFRIIVASYHTGPPLRIEYLVC